jgi:site-specific recombinase
MKNILFALTQPETDPVATLVQLVNALRPEDPDDSANAVEQLTTLCILLEKNPHLRAALRQAFASLFERHKAGSLYVSLGILPITGFFSESWRRLAHTVLPDVRDRQLLADVLAELFPRKTDEIWLRALPDELWLRYLKTLEDPESSEPTPDRRLRPLLDALSLISYRITVIGFEPELARLDTDLPLEDSPFVAQNLETRSFVEACRASVDNNVDIADDEKQLLVLLDQCRQAVERIHRRAAQAGTSLHLTYRLQCLRDHLRRAEQLAVIAGELQRDRSRQSAYPAIIALFKEVVFAHCRKNDLRTFWQKNLELTARRVTDYAGKAGEHYITENRGEYFTMAKAAMGAGVIIACMASLKIMLHWLHLAPLNAALAYGFNYGLGFMLIYMLGCTVATKQPAMTANAIAASIGETGGKVRDLENLTTLIARTTRSQLIAIIGNVSLAVPMAIGIGSAYGLLTGHPFIDQEEALQLLSDQHPWKSGALFFAAVAGVCLFLAGLIAGYVDNYATHNRLALRLKQLQWPYRWLSRERVHRLVDYIDRNLGALAGNFGFGLLLGGAWALGMLFGLPLDIRHVAFSSAYLGYALIAWDYTPPLGAFLWAALGVAGIGLVNLAVSFSLALYVALRARNVSFAQGRQLLTSILHRLRTRPGEFILPPRRTETP